MLLFSPRKYYNLFVALFLFSTSTDCKELLNPFAWQRWCCCIPRSPGLAGVMLNTLLMCMHMLSLPICLVGMKALAEKNPRYVCKQEYKVDSSSGYDQNLSLFSHCWHHSLLPHCHMSAEGSLQQQPWTSWFLQYPTCRHSDLSHDQPGFIGTPPILLTGWPGLRLTVMVPWHMHSAYTLQSLQLLAPSTWVPLLHSYPMHVHRKAPSPRISFGNSVQGGDRTDSAGQGQAWPNCWAADFLHKTSPFYPFFSLLAHTCSLKSAWSFPFPLLGPCPKYPKTRLMHSPATHDQPMIL